MQGLSLRFKLLEATNKVARQWLEHGWGKRHGSLIITRINVSDCNHRIIL